MGKFMGKMYEKWKRKKANILLNTSHLSDHFSWHSFRFPLSVAELSNVNDWQLYFLIGKQLIKYLFLRIFFKKRKKLCFRKIYFPETCLNKREQGPWKLATSLNLIDHHIFWAPQKSANMGRSYDGFNLHNFFWFLPIFKLSKTCFQNVSYETLHFLHFKRITSEIHLTLNVTHRERASI